MSNTGYTLIYIFFIYYRTFVGYHLLCSRIWELGITVNQAETGDLLTPPFPSFSKANLPTCFTLLIFIPSILFFISLAHLHKFFYVNYGNNFINELYASSLDPPASSLLSTTTRMIVVQNCSKGPSMAIYNFQDNFQSS